MTEHTTHGSDLEGVDPSAGKGVLFLAVLIVIGAIMAMFILMNRSVEGPLVVETEPEPISVPTQIVALQSAFVVEEKFTGLVTPSRTSQLGFTNGGRIQSLRVDIGDQIQRGQTLATLDTRTLQAQLAAAEAQVREAVAAHALAQVTVTRQQALFAKGHIAKQSVDEARAQADTAQARISAVEANAQAIKVQIDLSRIAAPFAGTITQRQVDEGAIAAPGQPIFELVETGALEARIGLTATLTQKLEPGTVYTLTSDQGPVQATLRSSTGVIDLTQRTITSVFDIVEPELIAAGSVVRLSLPQEIQTAGVWLPVSALTESDRGLWSVYAAREAEGGYRAAPGLVEIIHQTGEAVYVRGALRDGDQVIVDGLQRITPNQPVTPNLDASLTAASLNQE